jgi:hypothetical protein
MTPEQTRALYLTTAGRDGKGICPHSIPGRACLRGDHDTAPALADMLAAQAFDDALIDAFTPVLIEAHPDLADMLARERLKKPAETIDE